MAQIQTWQCDVCHIQKADTNHWWKVYLMDHDVDNVLCGLVIVKWDINAVTTLFKRELLPEQADAHLCGEQHLLEWVSKHLFVKQQNG